MRIAMSLRLLTEGAVFLALGLALYALGGQAWEATLGTSRLSGETRRLAAIETRLAASRAEKARLNARIRALAPGHLSRDLLDERARVILGLARSDERILILDSR